MEHRLARLRGIVSTITVSTVWVDANGRWAPTVLEGTGSEFLLTAAIASDATGIISRLGNGLRDREILSFLYTRVIVRSEMIILVDDFRDLYARVGPSEFERLCRWWIAIKDSPGFTDPDAHFDPIDIEYDQDVPDDLHPDFRFAIYIAEDFYESGNWTRAQKLEDLNAVYVWEPEGEQRSMIVSYDEIERDVAYDDRYLLGSPGTTLEELQTAFSAGLRT